MEPITWTVRDLVDDGHRVTFIAEFTRGDQPVTACDFLIDVPGGCPVVTDTMGRHLTASGQWVIPMVEVDGEWRPRPEDPADPWAREPYSRDVDGAVERACAAHAARLEGAADVGA